MTADALAELIGELPDGMVVTDPAITESYRQDRALDPSAGKPMAVVRPLRTEDVQTVLRWATQHRVPVVPRGAGSGLSGGATALDDGIVLSTERMRDITVDPVTRTAVVQPGLFNAEVKKAVAEHGLWYPPDPSSYRDLQHRRQHRHQRRRPVLRQVRRHHRLRARSAGRAGRRHRRPARRCPPQGRRRAEPDQAVRRQRGHAGRGHRDDPATAADATPVEHRGRGLRVAGGRRQRRARGVPAGCARRCWSSWTRSPSTLSRTS